MKNAIIRKVISYLFKKMSEKSRVQVYEKYEVIGDLYYIIMGDERAELEYSKSKMMDFFYPRDKFTK